MFHDKKVLHNFLESRGVDSVDALNMTEGEIPSVLLLNDAQKFIDGVYEDIKQEERITIVGDYDADGITGTTIALRSIRLIAKALNVEPFVSFVTPHRFTDGYGLSVDLVDRVLLENPKTSVIITVDNGVLAHEAVDYANQKGMKVYITDHHIGVEDKPKAYAMVNPNAYGDPYPFKGISGAAVVYKLFLELADQYLPEIKKDIKHLIDFVGISTVADMMPVLGENRYYIKETIDIFNGESDFPLRFAWLAMIEYLARINRISKDQVFNERDFGFTFGPILNAQSRVEGSADIAIDLFESTDTTDIREKVEYMVSINEQRKQLSNDAFSSMDKDGYDDQSVIVIRDDSLGEGFVGLVAGRITQHFNRPSVVFTNSKEGLKGSARSIDNVDLLNILRQVDEDIYVRMGGHAAAAGMTIHEDRLDDFTKQLESLTQPLIDPDLEFTLDYDIEVSEVDMDFIDSIDSLAPYGIDFERPVVKLSNLPVNQVVLMGKEKNHVKILTPDVDLVVWNASEEFIEVIQDATVVSAIGDLSINEFMGRLSIQMIVDERLIEFDS